MPITALLDACVLYPASLRDLLLSLAGPPLYNAKWSEEIHNEWIRNLIKSRPDLKEKQLRYTRDRMNLSVLDATVSGYEHLIESLVLPDPNDRHVLAAAIHARADVIVTFNLKDFPQRVLSQHCIESLHPDIFVERLISLNMSAAMSAIREQRARLRNPPVSVDDFLNTLENQGLPRSVNLIRSFAESV